MKQTNIYGDNFEIPTFQLEKQELLDKIWEELDALDAPDTETKIKLKLYNGIAEAYNKAAGKELITIIPNFQTLKQMAKNAKKAATKTAVKKAAKTGGKVKAEKGLSKGAQIIALAKAGLTVDQIVEKGFHKPSVQWYFSKFGFSNKKKPASKTKAAPAKKKAAPKKKTAPAKKKAAPVKKKSAPKVKKEEAPVIELDVADVPDTQDLQ